MSSSVLRAVPRRVALAIWLGGLELRDFGVGFESLESPGAPNADERMLDSVKSGWTPREVMLWIFPSFGGVGV